MNERIRLLAEQAGPLQEVLSKISEQNDDKGPRYIKNIGLLDFQLEKFAELIVRECADTVLGFHNQFGDSAHNEIRQHFGVEE